MFRHTLSVFLLAALALAPSRVWGFERVAEKPRLEIFSEASATESESEELTPDGTSEKPACIYESASGSAYALNDAVNGSDPFGLFNITTSNIEGFVGAFDQTRDDCAAKPTACKVAIGAVAVAVALALETGGSSLALLAAGDVSVGTGLIAISGLIAASADLGFGLSLIAQQEELANAFNLVTGPFFQLR
ncbi:MAG: hypothetical protein AAFU77_18070 [Myxococcota bacterium]